MVEALLAPSLSIEGHLIYEDRQITHLGSNVETFYRALAKLHDLEGGSETSDTEVDNYYEMVPNKLLETLGEQFEEKMFSWRHEIVKYHRTHIYPKA